MSHQREQLMQIATRLAALRDLSGYTQEELAEKLGVAQEEMAAYENGSLDIPVSILHAAAELMGVDLTELLTDVYKRQALRRAGVLVEEPA